MIRMVSTMMITLMLGAAGAHMWLDQAQASQGPGVAIGSASAAMQLAMAIAVYGGSALLVATGLIGAARRRKSETD